MVGSVTENYIDSELGEPFVTPLLEVVEWIKRGLRR